MTKRELLCLDIMNCFLLIRVGMEINVGHNYNLTYLGSVESEILTFYCR